MARARDWLLLPLVTVVAALGTGWGARSTLRSLRNRTPTPISCADLIAHRDTPDWVQLGDCDASFANIGIQTFSRKDDPRAQFVDPSAVFIPLRPLAGAGASSEERITLLLAVDHGPLLALGATYRTPDPAEIASLLEGPIEGMIERTLDRSARSRTEIRDTGLFLADDFLVIDYGKRPRPLWLALGALFTGLAALAYLVRRWRRRVKPPTVARATLVSG